MKIRELIKFSFDEMIRKFGQWFLFFIANCFAISLLILAVFMVKFIEVNQDDFKELFKNDIGKYGTLLISGKYGGQYTSDEFAEEDCMKIYNEIRNRLGDKYAPFYYENNSSMITDPDEQLVDIIEKSNELNMKRLGIVSYTKSAFDEFDIRYKKTDVMNEHNYPTLYLGSYWGDSLLGKVITVCDTSYFVEGILEENSKIPNQDIWNCNLSEFSTENNLNDAMVKVYSNDEYVREQSTYTYSLFMQFRYEGNFDEMQDKLKDLFYKYKGYVSVSKLEDAVYSALIPYKSLRNMCIIFVIVTFVTIEFIYSVNQFLYVINNKEDLGSFYTNGASVRDLVFIQFFKAGMQILFSLIVAIAGSYILAYTIGNSGGNDEVFKESVYKIMIHRTYPPVLIITTLLGFVLAIVPVIAISKNKPADLIR